MYEGEVIFSCADEDGLIEVVDEGSARTLHFGSRARQTTMLLRQPQALALAYTRCMMTGLLFVEPVRKVLILGLGGGALVRFLLHYFPDCRIDAVEKRLKVVDVARAFFALPEDPRLRIHVGSAERFVEEPGEEEYDLVLVDIHERDGMARGQAEMPFFAHCRRLLQPEGLLSINLWSGERLAVLRRVVGWLRYHFTGCVVQLPVAGKRNAVALAFAKGIEPGVLRGAGGRAEALERRTGVEFTGLLEELIRQNGRWA